MCARLRAIAAVAEAELPVPEEVVGPTPRSKMRISISLLIDDADKLDIGLVGEIGMDADFCANDLPRLACNGEVGVVDDDHEVRVAGGDVGSGNCTRPSASLTDVEAKAGTPMPEVTSTE